MAGTLVAGDLITSARDRSPTFDDRRHPDPVLLRALSSYQKELLGKIIRLDPSKAVEFFDQAVRLASRSDVALSDELAGEGIRLLTSQAAVVHFYGFNMADAVVGGYADGQRKLRQAISIAFDAEEEIAIFSNGRGIAAQSPIPPGIFGHEDGPGGINPVVYAWSDALGRPVRRALEEARKLLAEAGYPGGHRPGGEPLELHFITCATSQEGRSQLAFVRKQFQKLNIRLAVETSDYNRFNEKLRSGNFQFVELGWAGDYPDPENFLFLFHTPPAPEENQQNSCRYDNPVYNDLFVRMRAMENSPDRLAVIRRMLGLLRQDAPAVFARHPTLFNLYHGWYGNAMPHAMAPHAVKYVRIDVDRREAYRVEHNAPRWWPVAAFAAVLLVVTIPAVRLAAQHFRGDRVL